VKAGKARNNQTTRNLTQTDLISGLGVLLILIPFFMTTFDMLSDKSRAYFLMNIVGAGLALWGSILLKSLPFAILEGIWVAVALVGLAKSFRIKA